MAAGGSVGVSGDAGLLGGAEASLSVMPLSVSLAGALTTGYLFLRPLKGRAVARPAELALRAARVTLLWLVLLTLFGLLARRTFGLAPRTPRSGRSANSSTPLRRWVSGPPCPPPSSSDCCGSWACC